MSEIKREWLEKDYYKILGVERTASQKDITKAYRKLARKYHPDANSSAGAETKFKEISAAHSVLGDPKARKNYDEAQKIGMFQSGPRTTSGGGIHFETDDVGGFFARGTGARSGSSGLFNFGRNWPRDGEDVRAAVAISFDEAIRGRQVRVSNSDWPSRSPVAVRIPPLVQDGDLIRARGKGQPGADGGQDGDLLVRVKVGKHPVYERDGLNLKMNQKINFVQAVLGGEIIVLNYYGEKSTIAIQPGTQSGQTLRLRDKGLKQTAKGSASSTGEAKQGKAKTSKTKESKAKASGAKTGETKAGDLFVEIQVEVPTSLTDEQRDAVESLADAFGMDMPEN